MSGPVVAWAVVGLLSTAAIAAVLVGLVRHALVVGRAVGRLQREVGAEAAAVGAEAARAGERAARLAEDPLRRGGR
jgi:hypothetical protein